MPSIWVVDLERRRRGWQRLVRATGLAEGVAKAKFAAEGSRVSAQMVGCIGGLIARPRDVPTAASIVSGDANWQAITRTGKL